MKWTLAFGYAGLILVMSSIPSSATPVGLPLHLDKVAHAVVYAVLTVLFCRAADAPTVKTLILIAACSTVYGALNELYQSLIPGRDPSGWDAVANAVGSALATVAYRMRRSCACTKSD